MEDGMEAIVSNCNSVAEIWSVAKDNPTLKDALLESVTHTKITQTAIMLRLQLKGKSLVLALSLSQTTLLIMEHTQDWSTFYYSSFW